ncbi:transmembrane protein 207 [Alligator sinensis]|uniref:Transmembrane protein 207 n=1 Tax=Alligator sinensis TaxID=38654 RepID=A0A3Q0HAQ6_ALLSI|nr:transmembrane protein 207 [Alligator sinensis]
MWEPRASRFTLLISEIGGLCLTVFQLADPDPKCELNETCVGHHEENLSTWYVWFLMLFVLALILSCGILLCLQCWLEQRSRLPSRRALAVFALSDADTFCASTMSRCPWSEACAHPAHPEPCSAPLPPFHTTGPGSPPSYEDTMKTHEH